MKRRFILYRRKRGGMFYLEDTETHKQETTRTKLSELRRPDAGYCRALQLFFCAAVVRAAILVLIPA